MGHGTRLIHPSTFYSTLLTVTGQAGVNPNGHQVVLGLHLGQWTCSLQFLDRERKLQSLSDFQNFQNKTQQNGEKGNFYFEKDFK